SLEQHLNLHRLTVQGRHFHAMVGFLRLLSSPPEIDQEDYRLS
ncbi:MAG: hypothetical protein ACI91F_003373, partial [Candidatus Binatia bacterium]